MKIALLCPTRERLDLKQRLIDSLIETTSDLNNIVLYFGVDMDDPVLKETHEMADRYPWVTVIEIDNKGENVGLSVIWNDMVKDVPDEIFAMIGDDMVFKTKDWDAAILAKFETDMPKDNLLLIHCNDGMRGVGNHYSNMKPLAVHSFIHRKYYEIMGYYVVPDFKHGYHDTWLQEVFTALGRIYYTHDIMIDHQHYSKPASGMSRDSISCRLESTYAESDPHEKYKQRAQERQDEIIKLQDYIAKNA